VRRTMPHYMGVPEGAEIWASVEARFTPLLAADAEAKLLDLLTARFETLGTGAMVAATDDHSGPSEEEEPFDLDEPLVWAPDVLQHRSRGVVLVSRPPGAPVRLSGLARVLWPLFEYPASPAEVAVAVADEFGVDSATARDDVVRFARPLVAQGVLGPAVSARGEA
jgi:Coenzyme PQQ synthesis protein D (PqqD)